MDILPYDALSLIVDHLGCSDTYHLLLTNHAFNNDVLTPGGYTDFPKVNQDALEETISFILEKGIIDQCYSIAKDYSANATSSLKNLEPNKYKDLLELTVNTMINRDV